MSELFIAGAVACAVALVAGWMLPALAVSRLLPVLESSGHLITNYRGRRIPTGLGLVWIVWGAGVGTATAVVFGLRSFTPIMGQSSALDIIGASLRQMPVLLVVGAAVFGLIDDLYGDSSAKGFRGHVSALMHGRLTTGGLKLLGIGALAFAASAEVGQRVALEANDLTTLQAVAAWLLATIVIALAANLVNLTDLRPGRALKTYSFLVTGALICNGVSLIGERAIDYGLVPTDFGWLFAIVLPVGILAFGPVVAVWKLDLGESAMLGDAGANAMGAFAGFLLVVFAPLWFMAAVAVILLALNLASEKVSFSKVIERVGFLRWLDGLGRLPVSPERGMTDEGDDGVRAGGPADLGDDA